jgi:hypothetical protein
MESFVVMEISHHSNYFCGKEPRRSELLMAIASNSP